MGHPARVKSCPINETPFDDTGDVSEGVLFFCGVVAERETLMLPEYKRKGEMPANPCLQMSSTQDSSSGVRVPGYPLNAEGTNDLKKTDVGGYI